MKILTITATMLLAIPACAEAGSQRNSSAGKRPAATYSAAGSNSGGSSTGWAARQRHVPTPPVPVQPAYTRSAGQNSSTTATSSSKRFQFTEVAPRSLW